MALDPDELAELLAALDEFLQICIDIAVAAGAGDQQSVMSRQARADSLRRKIVELRAAL